MYQETIKKIHRHFFFLIFFLFLFSIALFTARSMVLDLNLSGPLKEGVFVLLLPAPFLFILAEILYRHLDNLFTRIIYLIGSYIGGIFSYWFMASVVLSLIYVLSLFFKIGYFFQLSFFLYSLALLFVIIGIFQAFKIKIKKYSVKVPAQYPQLAGKKFALVADTHFGPVNQEIFARRLFEKIIKEKPDAVFFPGDMFDSECYKDAENIKREIKVLTSRTPVFFSPGNHEQYGPFNHFMQIASEGGMTVLIDETVRFSGVPIFGLNFRQTKNADEVKKTIGENISPESPAIVLNHEPVFQNLLSDAGAFLVVSGHTHNGQFWPLKYGSKIFYGKFSYGLEKIGGLTSITTSGAGTWFAPLRTFNTPEIVVIEFK
jgi:predicted MPP superfamily phosphohydrolase